MDRGVYLGSCLEEQNVASEKGCNRSEQNLGL